MRILESCPRCHISSVRTTKYYHCTLFQILLLFLRLDEVSEIGKRLVDVQILQILHAGVPERVLCDFLNFWMMILGFTYIKRIATYFVGLLFP